MTGVPPPQFTAAAWAPIVTDDAQWLRHRDAAALRWLVQHAAGDRLVLCVGSHARHYLSQPGLNGQFARTASTVSAESGSAIGSAFAPDVTSELLGRAMHVADRHAIAVTETTFSLEGWAMELRAIDVRTGGSTVDTRTDLQRQLLARLVRVLHDGWLGQLARRMVRTYLEQLAESGMSWAVWAGSVVALSPENADLDQAEQYLPRAWKTEIADHVLWSA